MARKAKDKPDTDTTATTDTTAKTAADIRQEAGEVRQPTAEEIAETEAANVIQSEDEKRVDTIQSRAADMARKAIGQSESATYNAVTALALNLCGEQIRAVLTDQNYDPLKDDWIFKRDILSPLARDGVMIYRNTEDLAAEIVKANTALHGLRGQARKDAEAARNALAADYLKLKHTGAMKNGKPENVKLTDSLSTIRTYGKRLASYMRTNAGSVIIECARSASVESAEARWSAEIADRLSGKWSVMSSRLAAYADQSRAAKPGKAKSKDDDKPANAPTEIAQETAIATIAKAVSADKVAAILALIDAVDYDALMAISAHVNQRVGEIGKAAEHDTTETADQPATETAETSEPAQMAEAA